jgi:hypothetical protein
MESTYNDRNSKKHPTGRPRRIREWSGEETGSESAPYVAPAVMGGARPASYPRTRDGKPGSSGRRYVGRSGSAQRAKEIRQPALAAVVAPALPNSGSRQSAVQGARPAARVRVVPWSLRLAALVCLVGLLAVGLRFPALVVPPIDAPLGVEATHAATVNMLAGQVSGSVDPVRVLPLAPAWQGYAPTNPAGGLPLYTWLTAGLSHIPGGTVLAGRLVSIFFSLIAGICLFALVRRTAGARAGLYAMLAFAFSPLSVITGSQFAPFSMQLAAQAGAMLAIVRWSHSVSATRPGGSVTLFTLSVITAAVAALLNPGSALLLLPACYLIIGDGLAAPSPGMSLQSVRAVASWQDAWANSHNRGRAIGYGSATIGAALFWWLFSSASGSAIPLAVGDGGGGPATLFSALFSGSTYVQLTGLLAGKVLTVIGIVLLVAGLLQGARRPGQWLFHVWLLGGLAAALLDAGRIPRHDDVLLPLLLPAFALVGIGAAWAGSLPARVWLALSENRRESDKNYAVSPHTAWLLDLPEERNDVSTQGRPQAHVALGKSVAQRARYAGARMRRAGLMGLGHLAVLGGLGIVGLSGFQAASAQVRPKEEVVTVQAIAQEIDNVTPPDARLVIAGRSAPEIFYAAKRTGWALREDEFNISTLQALQRNGATYLVSADQEWLGRHTDYVGVLTSYTVKSLTRDFIMFDLGAKPAANDRLYFLETGHTLGGEFRTFWDRLGGVKKLGYPLSEEVSEANPLDGQVRRIQYFERAVLEYHPELAGTPGAVMLADVGRWVTKGRAFQAIEPFQNKPNRVYFPQSGHSLKEAFLLFWQREGGVVILGYPISEELPEISKADGKVYTVQYFERARLEWHPTEAGTPTAVQLGLIGKEAMEARR